jgi:hypothetical protein
MFENLELSGMLKGNENPKRPFSNAFFHSEPYGRKISLRTGSAKQSHLSTSSEIATSLALLAMTVASSL